MSEPYIPEPTAKLPDPKDVLESWDLKDSEFDELLNGNAVPRPPRLITKEDVEKALGPPLDPDVVKENSGYYDLVMRGMEISPYERDFNALDVYEIETTSGTLAAVCLYYKGRDKKLMRTHVMFTDLD